MFGMNFGKKEVAPKLKNPESKLDISYTDGVEVMQNLEISEQNIEFTKKMVEIENELKKRSYLGEITTDTGEIVMKGKSKFDSLKEHFLDTTKRSLTNPSKYIKGAVISGLVATGLLVDFLQYGPIVDHIVDGSIDALNLHGDAQWTVTGPYIGVFIGAVALTVRNSIKAVSQTIKSKVVADQKMQRFIGLLATEDNLNTDKIEMSGFKNGVVDTEAHRRGGYEKAGETYLNQYDLSDKQSHPYNIENKEKLAEMRQKLEEVGIPRIDRSKFINNKSDSNVV